MNRSFTELKNDIKFQNYITNIFIEKSKEFNNNNILEIELTNKCSIGCFYCGAIDSPKLYALDFDTLCHTIIKYTQSRTARNITPHLSFTGGDPLEYQHIEKLVHFISERHIPFNFKLNPSTASVETQKLLANAGCGFVKLTFMGIRSQAKYRNKDTLEDLRSVTRGFLADNIPVVWHLSIGDFNREDLLASLGFILENKVTAISIGRLAQIGRLKETRYPINIAPEVFKAFLKEVLLFFYNNKRYGFNLAFKEKLWVPFLIEEGILDAEKLMQPGTRLGCDAGERLLVLTYAGELLPCGLLPERVLARLEDTDFTNHINCLPVAYPLPGKDPCLSCSYCEVCRGCRGVLEGANAVKDPQCWL